MDEFPDLKDTKSVHSSSDSEDKSPVIVKDDKGGDNLESTLE